LPERIPRLRLEDEKWFGDTASASFNILGRVLNAVAQNALVRERQPNQPRIFANAIRVNPALHIPYYVLGESLIYTSIWRDYKGILLVWSIRFITDPIKIRYAVDNQHRGISHVYKFRLV
jgi:hypothetical protein